MAIIYSYPTKTTPVGTDMVLISDSESTNPANQTKQASIASIKTTIDVVDSVVAGSGISVSSATGDVTIGNTGVLSLTATLPISVSASTGSIDISSRVYSGGSTTGHVPSGGDNTRFLRGDGGWVVPTNTTDITLTTAGTSGASTWDGTTLNIPQYSDGVDGSGTANQVPMWSDSDTLTDSIMKQVGSGVSAKLVIGGNPNNGLTFENTGTGIPDVTLLPFNGASGANWDMRLPAPPTAGGQVMSLPSTLGSSPYQLEWTTPTTGTGTQYNIPMFATTTTLGDSLLSQDAGATTITFGTAASGQTLDISGQNKISFKGDSTNSWIAANNANPESLEIHADSYLYLRPDEYVVINGVASAPTNADDPGDMGSVVWDTNYLYIAVADDEWKRVALATW